MRHIDLICPTRNRPEKLARMLQTVPETAAGRRFTGILSKAYRDYLLERLAGGRKGSADLCAYFFLRAGELVRQDGMITLLATNTIAQGDTREVGLEQLAARGFSISRAVASQPWPGEASLEVAQVWLKRGAWDGDNVPSITYVRAVVASIAVGLYLGSSKRESPCMSEKKHILIVDDEKLARSGTGLNAA